jgi:hypothetical protein
VPASPGRAPQLYLTNHLLLSGLRVQTPHASWSVYHRFLYHVSLTSTNSSASIVVESGGCAGAEPQVIMNPAAAAAAAGVPVGSSLSHPTLGLLLPAA